VQIQLRDRRARRGAAGAYLVQGLCFAGLLSQVPALQKKFDFTDGQLELILLVVPVVAGLGSLLAGILAPRIGSGLVLRIAGPLVCAAMTCVGFAGTRAELYPSVALFGLALGLVDATMNMQGVAVQHRYGRSILVSFHGAWSIGGIAGALADSGAGRLGLELGPTLGSIALAGVILALLAGPLLYRRAEAVVPTQPLPAEPAEPTGPTGPARRAGRPGQAPKIPWRPLVPIGIAVMMMYIADSATSNWSAKYLDTAMRAGRGVVPLGLAAYLTCQVLGRLVADRPVRRYGPVPPVAVGGLVGGVGMAAVALAPTAAVAVAGFAVVGLGLCVVVPQSFSAAGALDPTGSGVAVARINLFNYVGFVAGAALIGEVDQAAGLRWAFAVPAILCLVVFALAPSFRVAAVGASGWGVPSWGAAGEQPRLSRRPAAPDTRDTAPRR
jgi:MFS family permease